MLALAPGAQAGVPVELGFDGRPFESAAPPEFTCFNATLGCWVVCRVEPTETPGAWRLERPVPGVYRMHVSIDDNPANPAAFPATTRRRCGSR